MADMNEHAKDYFDKKIETNKGPMTMREIANRHLSSIGVTQTEPPLKEGDMLVNHEDYKTLNHLMAPIPRPPMKPPTVHPPVKDEDDDDDLLGLGIAAVEVGIDLMSGGSGSDDSSSSDSGGDWSGGGGDFDGGGASGDW